MFNAFRYKGAVFRNLLNIEAVVRRCSKNLVFLNILQNSLENTCARVSFLRKLQVSACNFIKKETLPQVFSYEFCEIFKNTFFYGTPSVAAFVNIYDWAFFF